MHQSRRLHPFARPKRTSTRQTNRLYRQPEVQEQLSFEFPSSPNEESLPPHREVYSTQSFYFTYVVWPPLTPGLVKHPYGPISLAQSFPPQIESESGSETRNAKWRGLDRIKTLRSEHLAVRALRTRTKPSESGNDEAQLPTPTLWEERNTLRSRSGPDSKTSGVNANPTLNR